MKIIQDNPYRLLGVYSNSPKKDRMANLSRMRAFLKVGRAAACDLDLNGIMPPAVRTNDNVAEAEASLTLPKDQMRFAQFWFIKVTPLDEVAFNHLKAGEVDAARDIWKKRCSASSLQNLTVLALIRKDYREALSTAETLYGSQELTDSFFSSVTGEEVGTDSEELAINFIDAVADEAGVGTVMSGTSNQQWKLHLGRKVSKPLSDSISESISSAKAVKDPTRALRAAETLRNEAGPKLIKLREAVGSTSDEYQVVADKLADTILQCGIRFYNKGDDRSRKSLMRMKSLFEYAQGIAEGQFEKDRCAENMSVLKENIEMLPPEEIEGEVMAVLNEIKKFDPKTNDANQASAFLDRVKPRLKAIRLELGYFDKIYINLSTGAVSLAHNCVVREINNAIVSSKTDKRLSETNDLVTNRMMSLLEYTPILKISHLYDKLELALKVFKKMEGFDMDERFRREQFLKNQSDIMSLFKEIAEQKALIDGHFSTPHGDYYQKEENSGCSSVPAWVWFIVCGVIFWILIAIVR